MATTVQITNRKGGVGKTTLAITLSSWLAGEKGCRIVLVDTDPQGNVARWFGMTEEPCLYQLFVEDGELIDPEERQMEITRLLRMVPQDRWWPNETEGILTILPGDSMTAAVGDMLSAAHSPSNMLRRALMPLQSIFDFVVLDASPTVTALTANVFVASDYAVIPTETKILSVHGALKTDDTIDAVQGKLPLEMIGIVPTMHSNWKLERRTNYQTLVEEFGDLVWPALADRVPWEECPSYGKSIFSYAPRHKAAKEARKFCEKFWGAMEEREVV